MIGLPGPELDRETAARLRTLDAGGLILFRRNLVDPQQTRRLVAAFRDCVTRPALVAIDQEGGPVSRLEGWIGPTPCATALARAGSSTIREFAEATATALRRLDVDLDFAPVVDLSDPDAPNGIGARAFGTDPALVSRMAGSFLRGLQDGGVAGCLKHFPGLGDTVVDSHRELPEIPRDAQRLRREDLRPYRDLAGQAASIMVGHGHYPALDPVDRRPATCSPAIVRELLRREMGFDGLIVSDDLEMGAVAARDVDGAAAVEALGAGCDLLLYCADLDRAENAAHALDREGAADPAFARRLADAASRVYATAERWAGRAPAGDWDAALADFARFRHLA